MSKKLYGVPQSEYSKYGDGRYKRIDYMFTKGVRGVAAASAVAVGDLASYKYPSSPSYYSDHRGLCAEIMY